MATSRNATDAWSRSKHGAARPTGRCAGATAMTPMPIDGGRAGTPHPLQLANPDHDIAICEAGCNGPRGALVYMRRKPPRAAP